MRSVHLDFAEIDSPAIPVENAYSRIDCIKAMQPDVFGLVPLSENEQVQTLDVAFMGRKNQLAHCGIVIETVEGLRILHCQQSASGVALDDLLSLKMMGFPVVRYFRHVHLHEKLAERGYLTW